MTKEELNRRRMMFQINAKRNELLKPEDIGISTVRHSATNDFLAFRKKVAAGMKKQKEQNVEVFNVTAANLQNYQDMLDNNELIHAGMTNQYIAKLDDFYGKGKPRYFYDQTEWDNYRKNMQGAGQAAADRGAREGADAKNKNLANKAQEAFTKSSADYKNKDLVNKAQEAFNNSPAANTEFRTSTDAYKNKELLTSNQKSKENAIKRSNPEYQKELEKAKSIKEDKDRWGAYSESDLKEISKDKRFSNIKTEDDAVNYPGGVEKLYNDLETALEEKFPGKKKNYEASKNAGADRAAKEKENAEKDVKKSPKTLADDYTTDNTSYKAMVSEVSKAIKNGEVIMVGDAPRPVMDSNWKISENGQKAFDAWKKVMNEVNDAAGNTENYSEFKGQILKNLKKDLSAAEEKEAKHSSLEDGITTDAMTPDQEYIAFRKKVEAGIKHFGTTRGLMTIPKNQALADGDSMSHAGMTNKYYAKLDDFWGKGKPRYFYSKEEWDGYQKNAGYAQNAEKNKAINQKNSLDTNYQKNKDYAKNAGADRAKKDEWNAASKKTGLSYKEGTNKEYDNQYKQDKKELDEAFWQGKGDLKKAQEKMSKYDHNMESGKDFYVNDDGEAKLGDNYSFKLSDDHYVGQEPEWTAPGLKDPNEHEWSDEDVKKVAKYNQPIIDHCVEFYEKYVLENDETLNSGRKKFTAWDVEHEIQDYLNRVIPRAFPEYRDEERSAGYFRSIPNNAGYALKQVLWQLIKNRIDSEKKAWDRTHKK